MSIPEPPVPVHNALLVVAAVLVAALWVFPLPAAGAEPATETNPGSSAVPSPGTVSPGTVSPSTIAVLYFHNQGNPELEPLEVGLAQMLITDLTTAAADRWTVVERTQLQAILDELQLGHDGVVDPATAARLGKLLGAEWLVLGSFFELVGTLRVDARLVHVQTGRIAYATGVDGSTPDFKAMEARLAAGLAGALIEARAGESPDEPGPSDDDPRASAGGKLTDEGERYVSGGPGATAILAPDPDALDAAVAFSEGLILLDGKDTARAREAFETALVKDPALEAARAQLAALEL